jgi:hypothetical protein
MSASNIGALLEEPSTMAAARYRYVKPLRKREGKAFGTVRGNGSSTLVGSLDEMPRRTNPKAVALRRMCASFSWCPRHKAKPVHESTTAFVLAQANAAADARAGRVMPQPHHVVERLQNKTRVGSSIHRGAIFFFVRHGNLIAAVIDNGPTIVRIPEFFLGR